MTSAEPTRPRSESTLPSRGVLFAFVGGLGLALLAAGPLGCRAGDRGGASARAAATDGARESSGKIFGTTYHVKAHGVGPDGPDQARFEALVAEALASVDADMSTYKADSELSQFNRLGPGSAFEFGAQTTAVLRVSDAVVTASDGAFDPTVGPLVRAWGFGPDERPSAPPNVDALRRRVGWSKLELELDGAHGRVTKTLAGQEIDLSAVAKGYGVDRVAEALTAAGVPHYMVEVGGEVRTAGHNPDGQAWRIGIERPDAGVRAIEAVVALSDRALATSGDYRNYYEVDGRRVSHTIDPRTGAPIEHRLASVSVVAPTCAEADAWATALNVLGPDAGAATARARRLEFMMIVRTTDGFEVRKSDGFPVLEH